MGAVLLIQTVNIFFSNMNPQKQLEMRIYVKGFASFYVPAILLPLLCMYLHFILLSLLFFWQPWSQRQSTVSLLSVQHSPRFSPPQTSIIMSYFPSCSKYSLSITNRPPAIIGVLDGQRGQRACGWSKDICQLWVNTRVYVCVYLTWWGRWGCLVWLASVPESCSPI